MWKDQARDLFFLKHMSITDISEIVKRSRQAVGNYLKTIDVYEEEKKWRMKQNKGKRKDYQRHWDRTKRNKGDGLLDQHLLKRQHFIDVGVLSYERIFNP
ncbi:hypothetical protein [Anaerosolibacter sp.]|uniref:hypothetical protein n=1 Tax=Anaerosolibacter sp. TaxID=1872527 RepID=UPI0039EF05D3